MILLECLAIKGVSIMSSIKGLFGRKAQSASETIPMSYIPVEGTEINEYKKSSNLFQDMPSVDTSDQKVPAPTQSQYDELISKVYSLTTMVESSSKSIVELSKSLLSMSDQLSYMCQQIEANRSQVISLQTQLSAKGAYIERLLSEQLSASTARLAEMVHNGNASSSANRALFEQAITAKISEQHACNARNYISPAPVALVDKEQAPPQSKAVRDYIARKSVKAIGDKLP